MKTEDKSSVTASGCPRGLLHFLDICFKNANSVYSPPWIERRLSFLAF